MGEQKTRLEQAYEDRTAAETRIAEELRRLSNANRVIAERFPASQSELEREAFKAIQTQVTMQQVAEFWVAATERLIDSIIDGCMVDGHLRQDTMGVTPFFSFTEKHGPSRASQLPAIAQQVLQAIADRK